MQNIPIVPFLSYGSENNHDHHHITQPITIIASQPNISLAMLQYPTPENQATIPHHSPSRNNSSVIISKPSLDAKSPPSIPNAVLLPFYNLVVLVFLCVVSC